MTTRGVVLGLGLTLLATGCLTPPEGPPATTNAGFAAEPPSAATPPNTVASPSPHKTGFVVDGQEPDQSRAPYTTFFDHLRWQVTQSWHPTVGYRRNFGLSTVFGPCDNQATELGIELLPNGALRDVRVLKSCGLAFLDEDVIGAVRTAAPYEPPPRALVGPSGVFRFRFKFVFASGPVQSAQQPGASSVAPVAPSTAFHLSTQGAPQQNVGRFAPFFNSVHRQVTEHWHPDAVYRQRDPAGPLYGPCAKHATELIIELGPDGALRDVQLLKSCGLDFLDQDAITAFRSVSRFEPPPPELIEDSGVIRFRYNFAFESRAAEPGPQP